MYVVEASQKEEKHGLSQTAQRLPKKATGQPAFIKRHCPLCHSDRVSMLLKKDASQNAP